MRWKIIAAFVLCLAAAAQADEASFEPTEFPSLVSTVRALGPLEFCGEPVPLEVQETRERLEKEVLLSVWKRSQVILWLKRSTRYFPYIETVLAEAKMPDDLKYIAVVESALLPHIRSTKGAVGFWQFLASTGRKYGLTITERIDQRRNLFASTQAALRYLRELHAMFGSWTLAAAAYNMGEDGLMAEILEQGTDDYYSLYLPLETQGFLLRVVAVKLIFVNPELFGFKLTEEDHYPPVTFDEVEVDLLENMPIRIIAQASQTSFKMIKDLNPEIRGHYLASGSYNLLIPKGASKGFHARLRGLEEAYLSERRRQIYVIEKGDTLSSIAEKLSIPLSALIMCNHLDPRRPIHPGGELYTCPKQTKRAKMKSAQEDP